MCHRYVPSPVPGADPEAVHTSFVNNYFQWFLQGIKVALISAAAFIVVNGMLDSKVALDAFHRFKTILAKRC